MTSLNPEVITVFGIVDLRSFCGGLQGRCQGADGLCPLNGPPGLLLMLWVLIGRCQGVCETPPRSPGLST